MIYVFLADGFEEIEALTVVDVMKRAEIDVKTVGVTGSKVVGTHGITVTADINISELETKHIDMIVLPGGMPGTLNLEKSQKLINVINYCISENVAVAAICAAPSILGHMGYLRNKHAVCFPGFESEMKGAIIEDKKTCIDGNIITGKGAGVALDFAFVLVGYLTSENKVLYIKQNMQCE